MTPMRHPANGQSGGRGADVWVVVSPKQAAWLARNVGGSLSVMSKDDEVVRIRNFTDAAGEQEPSLFEAAT